MDRDACARHCASCGRVRRPRPLGLARPSPRGALADRVLHHGLDDLDAGAIRRRAPRRLTQEISRYLFEHGLDEQDAAVAGVRYLSRLGDDLVNWAIFESNEPSEASSEPFDRDDVALRVVFERFALSWG